LERTKKRKKTEIPAPEAETLSCFTAFFFRLSLVFSNFEKKNFIMKRREDEEENVWRQPESFQTRLLIESCHYFILTGQEEEEVSTCLYTF
jgi:hypothetical protein